VARSHVPAWSSFALLALAAALLGALWRKVPARWPVHYGLAGTPDRWADKSIPAAFWPLGLGILLCGLLELLARFLPALSRGRSAPGLSESGRLDLAAASADFVRLVALAIALLLSVITVALPLLRPESPKLIIATSFAAIGVAVFLGLRRFLRVQRSVAAAAGGALQGWHGLLYKNPDDPRLWVPKLLGIGYTLNFSHGVAWLILGLILAAPLAVVAAIAWVTFVAR
jgi:uncharacterized membrane protein